MERISQHIHKLTRPIRRVGYGYLEPRNLRKAVILWSVVLLLLITLLIGLWYGFDVPSKIRTLVQEELVERGLEVEIGDLKVSFLGQIVIKDVRILQKRGEEETSIEIGRVRFWPNWFSWWRRQPWINKVSVDHSSLRLPITSTTSIDFGEVQGRVRLEKGVIVIEQAQGKIGQLKLSVTGRLLFDQAWKPETSVRNNEGIAQIWKRTQRILDELGSTVHARLHFEGPVHDPLQGHATLLVDSEKLWVKSLFIPRLMMRAIYEDRSARLDEFRVEMTRGSLDGEGVFSLDESKGEVHLTCQLDPSLLSPLLNEAYRPQLENLRFNKLVQIEGLWEGNWQNELEYFVRLNAVAENFQMGDTAFDQFKASISYDGTRLLLYDVFAQDKTGNVSLEFLMDADRSVTGKLQSTIDWTHFKAILPASAQPFFNSLEFGKEGPQIECKLEGNLPNPDFLEPGDHWIDWLEFTGKIDTKDVAYTNGKGTRTNLKSLSSPFRFAERVLHLSDLKIERVPGEEAQSVVDYDFKNRIVRLENARGVLDIQKTAPIFGPKMETYVAPYRLKQAASIEANGLVDLKEEKKTDLKLNIQSNGPLEYDFLRKTVLIRRANVGAEFKGKRAVVQIKPGTSVFEGELTGRVDLDLDSKQPPFEANMKGNDLSLQKILHVYFNKDDVKGATNGEVRLEGRLGDLRSLKGEGRMVVREGDIYRIPVFDGLSTLLSAIASNVGHGRASDAESRFTFSNGKIHIQELEMTSLAFAVIGYGSYDYMKDDIDLSVRVNARGIAGIAFFPLSKLFEYQGRGPLGNTEWQSKVF